MKLAVDDTSGNTLACLIIDDPLIRRSYGCLDYERLLEAMKVHDFFAEIAFIPWNYKRSEKRTAKLIADNCEYFALCVHGCNHTGNEFGGTDYQGLSALAHNALWCMEEHKRLTGIPFDPVMVFPQGRFSSVAMQVLRDQGYVAAFNSNIRAVDREEPAAIEYARPATLMYSGLPLFSRRYSKERGKLEEDLSKGRPLVLVEHHGAFRDGYGAVTDVVDWLNGLGTVRWTSLLEIAEHYVPRQEALVEPAENRVPYAEQSWSKAKVCLRRHLSEARDNYVETNRVLSKGYAKLRG